MSASPPLVLMHGLWDTPRLFRRLIQALDQPERPLLAPHLPHGLGHVWTGRSGNGSGMTRRSICSVSRWGA